MNVTPRKLAMQLLVLLGFVGVAWAVSFSSLPPADFRFNNGDEVKTVDPAKATGQPEHVILTAIFEGLLQTGVDERAAAADQGAATRGSAGGNQSLVVQPGVAELPRISADGKTYRFPIRPAARWSDDTPVTAHDFVWSWRRTLHPETGSQYAYQLFYLVGAQKYNAAEVAVGDQVEVELDDRPKPHQTFPRGTMVRGRLAEIVQPPAPQLAADASPAAKKQADAAWKDRWVYVVETAPNAEKSADKTADDKKSADAKPERRAFSKSREVTQAPGFDQVATCKHVLLDFETQVGVRAEGDHLLVVTLNAPTPFFSELVAFYPLYPVNRRCIETHGVPDWTRPENIVVNGPFTLKFRRLRDRIRLVKNPHYWDADRVKLNLVDAFPIKSETTSLNMYLQGQLDWTHPAPVSIMPEIRRRDDFVSAPMFTTYFYRLNTTRPPFDDVRVRRALNAALDKKKICEEVIRGGQLPATSFVPPGMPGYQAVAGPPFDPEGARKLLATVAAEGRALPRIEILFNSNEAHSAIAEVIQHDWRETLGVEAQLRALEWGVYLSSIHKMDYQVARAGWVADYSDPNTFLDMFVTGGENNETGWSNAEYDRLIAAAGQEVDGPKRMELLRKAEAILLDELPILPIYSYVSINLVRPYVRGFHANVQDKHPLHLISIDPLEKRRVFAAEGLSP